MTGKKLSFAQIKQIAETHLKVAFGEELQDVAITFAKQGIYAEHGEVWRINIEYTEIEGAQLFKRSALFTLDARTGEIIEFKKDTIWKF